MVDPLILNRKLQRLASYLGELEEMSGLTLEDYLSDFRHRRAVERLIQVIVDVSVDINTHAVVDAGRQPPADSYTSFLAAAEIGLIPLELARQLAPSTGERNIIVHEYEIVDDTIVFESITGTLRLYRKYLKSVSEYLKKHGS